jgi:hypothetical protein
MSYRFHRHACGGWQTGPNKEKAKALVPLATKGNYFHVYDFRVKPGRGDEFVELFNKFDYGDNNPFHARALRSRTACSVATPLIPTTSI